MQMTAFDPADAATVAGWSTSVTEASRWCGHAEHPFPAPLVASWGEADDVLPFVLRDSDTVVGYGELWLEEGEVELARLIVDPSRRGRGLGRQLVTELTALARVKAPLVCLRVHPDNVAAARVYRAAGFLDVDAATADEWNAGQPVPYVWLTAPGIRKNST